MSKTKILKLVEDEDGNIMMEGNIRYRIEEVLDEEETKPVTKEAIEALGYACGEIEKCFKGGYNKSINNEPLKDDDNDVPLIPDDELWSINGKKGIIEDTNTYSEISRDTAINYNFKVLQEKINQVVKEFNEYRKENE